MRMLGAGIDMQVLHLATAERAAGDLLNRHSYVKAVSDAADAMAENYPEPKDGDH